MIRLDLADATGHAGPPPAYLLGLAMSMFVVLPLLLSAGLYRAWSDAVADATASEREIASQRQQAAAAAARQRQFARLQAVLDGATKLRNGSLATLEVVPAVTAHLQPGTRLTELFVDTAGVRILGKAPAASDISLWLSRSAGRDEALVWAAPEIRNAAAGDGGVEFGLRIRRAAAGLREPEP